MNPLQYTSEEMYSSTELIRKSKTIFEKLQKKDIEKAVILRDGKPSFMMMDFNTYEKLMKEYLELKDNTHQEKPKKSVKEKPKTTEEYTKVEELDEKSLEEALNEIENLDLEQEPLKEFWE